MTIREQREREVQRLARYKTEDPTEADVQEARRLMNSFYRLCGLCETNLYLQNDERRHNTRYAHESEKREERWAKRLREQFSENYGLTLVYCGYAPSIGVVHEGGGFSERISRFFYR